MKNIRKIYLDYDGTICNTIKSICFLYNEDFQYYTDFSHARWEFVDKYNFKDECPLMNSKVLHHYFCSPRFFDNLEFMDNAKEVINKLQDEGYQVEVVSMGLPANLRLKYKWIVKNLPGVGFIAVDSQKHKDKTHVNMSDGIFLDDYAGYLNTNAIRNICFGDKYEWNKYWTGERVYNWCDFYKYLHR